MDPHQPAPQKKLWVKIIVASVVLFTFAGYFILLPHYENTQWEKIEREIDQTFYPIVQALHRYKKYTGHFPASLETLRPDLLEQVPSSPLVQKVDYRLNPTDKVCQLTLTSTTNESTRIYRHTSSGQAELKPDEQVLKSYRTWYIIQTKQLSE